MTMRHCLIVLLFSWLIPWAALAGQTAYVSDELRVGVREAPGRKSVPLVIIRSGDRVEVLERRRGYLKVRTENGVVGWVKAAYITSKPPIATKLKEKVEELTFLKEKLAQIDAQTATVNDRLAAMQRRIDSLQRENQELRTTLSLAQQELERQRQAPALARLTREVQERPWWLVLAGGMILFLAGGFLVGVYWYRHQVSKRLGGFTI